MSFEFVRRPEAVLQLEPALYVVATPIGNLADITLRALQVMDAVGLVLAEDTRVTRRLFAHYSISQRVESCHEQNEQGRVPLALECLGRGEAVALVSDAGTPLISDPGFPLVRAVREAGFGVVSIPGPSALAAAVSVSGLSCDRFAFEGFLPAKPAARRARLAGLAMEVRTLIFYEAGRRIPALLADLAEKISAERQVVLARELTKLHEEVQAGPAGSLADRAGAGELELRGEFVVLVAGAGDAGEAALADARRIRDILAEELPASGAARLAARITGVDRRTLYAEGEKN